jgi:hypothetical protein
VTSSTPVEILIDEATEPLRKKLDRVTATSNERANEIRRLSRQLGATTKELEELTKAFDLVRSIKESSPKVPKWRAPKSKKGKSRAIPTLLLSDLHLDEVVNPAEIEWYNAYNREIAELRLQHVFQTAVHLARDYMSNLIFDGIVVALGGDILTGDIHAELAKSNETTVFDSVVHWVPQLAAGLEMLADEFGSVFVPCVVGNHDRNPANKRPPAKQRAKDSVSWVIYQWLADRFRTDSRIQFQVAEGSDLIYPVYDFKFLLTHGDTMKGGSGIAGIFTPLMKGNQKRTQRQVAFGNPYDHMLMGHFHQLTRARGITANGSLIGYNEFAMVNAFEPEHPQQAFFVTVPERGITCHMDIDARSPKETWRQ